MCANGHRQTIYGKVTGKSEGTLRFKLGVTVKTRTVGSDGSYGSITLDPSTWNVAYKPPSGTYSATTPSSVVITSSLGYCNQDFDPARLSLSGTVLDAEGQPVTASQELSLNGEVIWTAPDGSFTVAVQPGDCDIAVNGAPVAGLARNGEIIEALTVPEPETIVLEVKARRVLPEEA